MIKKQVERINHFKNKIEGIMDQRPLELKKLSGKWIKEFQANTVSYISMKNPLLLKSFKMYQVKKLPPLYQHSFNPVYFSDPHDLEKEIEKKKRKGKSSSFIHMTLNLRMISNSFATEHSVRRIDVFIG